MKVHMNTGGIAATNCFLVADEHARVAVLFDAPNDTTAPLIEQARQEGWDIVGLWLTHGHFDHVWDHAAVTAACPNAKVLIHELEEPKLFNPQVQTGMFGLPDSFPPRKADGYLNDGQKLAIGNLAVEVIHTPGHAPGHCCFYFPDEKVLVGGDLIIGGSIGRTDLPDSVHAELEASIRRVLALPPETRLLPGHGEPSTLAEERRTNLYVRHIVNR